MVALHIARLPGSLATREATTMTCSHAMRTAKQWQRRFLLGVGVLSAACGESGDAGNAGTGGADASSGSASSDGSTRTDSGSSSDSASADGGSSSSSNSGSSESGTNDDTGGEPPIICIEQCVYVRQAAVGAGSGADWNDALTALPDPLERDHVYFVAAGTYDSYEFDDPDDGDKPITIQRATAGNHGTDVGWQPDYGEGLAAWRSPLVFTSSHWEFDGSTRNEDDWFDGQAYGFTIDNDGQDQNIIIANYGVSLTDIAIRYVFVDAIYGDLPDVTIRRYAIDTDGFDGGSTATQLLFHRMYVRGSNNVWFLRTTDGAVVEYSASDGAASNGANHGEVVNLYYSGNNAVIRYNRWRNEFIGNGGTALVAITDADGLQFYGNVLSHFQVGDASVGFAGYASSGNRVYNNTFVDSVGYNAGTAWGDGTDNLEFNNLFINCPTVSLAGEHDDNAFSDGDARGEANAQVNTPTSVFADYAGQDFRLASPTLPGSPLAAPYDADLLGTMRGADGAWDRGAYEYAR
jgi:hypothetical protein